MKVKLPQPTYKEIVCGECNTLLQYDPQTRYYTCPLCKQSLSELRMIVTGKLNISENEKLEYKEVKGYAI
jgi:LSD1 subclass zinc finger protein